MIISVLIFMFYNFSVEGHMELYADFAHALVLRKIVCWRGSFMLLEFQVE